MGSIRCADVGNRELFDLAWTMVDGVGGTARTEVWPL